MCQSKQTALIGFIFGSCILGAIGLTAAYFVYWHQRGHPSPPVYNIISFNARTTEGLVNGTRRSTKKNNGILKLHEAEGGTTELPTDFSTEIALLIGGKGSNKVEVFSVNQASCTKHLMPLPIGQAVDPVASYVRGELVICASSDCWTYNFRNDSWMDLTRLEAPPSTSLYALKEYMDKLYFILANKLKRYDLKTKQWEDLSQLQEDPGAGACVVIRSDWMYVFGGQKSPRTIYQYNFKSKNWVSEDTKGIDDFIIYSSCVMNGDQETLFIGNQRNGRSARYNFDSKTWSTIHSDPTIERSGSTIVNLNGRIFAVGGGNHLRTHLVEELSYNSWIPANTSWAGSLYRHATVNIPAYLIKCSRGNQKQVNPGAIL